MTWEPTNTEESKGDVKRFSHNDITEFLNSALLGPNLSWTSSKTLIFFFLSKFELGFVLRKHGCPDQYTHFPALFPPQTPPPWASRMVERASGDLNSGPGSHHFLSHNHSKASIYSEKGMWLYLSYLTMLIWFLLWRVLTSLSQIIKIKHPGKYTIFSNIKYHCLFKIFLILVLLSFFFLVVK